MNVWVSPEEYRPIDRAIIEGVPMATGAYGELIVNKTNLTIDDMDTDPYEDPSNNNPYYINIMIGGRSLTAMRKDSKYYLVVNKIN